MLIGGRMMTMDGPSEDGQETGPSSAQMQSEVTPKLDHKYFDKEMCMRHRRKQESLG